MPITISSLCNTCKGEGYTFWMHNDVPWTQPCKECNGAGRVSVSVRTIDDTLWDAYQHYGVGSATCKSGLQVGGLEPPTYTDPPADTIPAKPHACLDCLAFGDAYDDSDEIIHTPCERHPRRQPDPAPERGDDSDSDQRGSGRAAAATFCGHTDAGSPCFRLDGPGEGVPPGVRGPLPSEPGASMNQCLSGSGEDPREFTVGELLGLPSRSLDRPLEINAGLERWDQHPNPADLLTEYQSVRVAPERTITVHLKREGKVILPLAYEDEP